MSTQRLSVDERRGFARYAANIGSDAGPFARRYQITPPEPALGTLDERLAIIVRRHGGRVGPIKLTPAERSQLAAYQDQELTAA